MHHMARPILQSFPLVSLLSAATLISCASQEPVRTEVTQSTNPNLDGTKIPSARSMLAAARAQRAADNPPAAARLIEGLLKLHPGYVSAYEELALLKLEVGNLPAARLALDEGLRLAPDHLGLMRLDGAYHVASGDLDAAYERYRAVADADPLRQQAQMNVALVEVLRGNDAEALQTLNRHFDEDRAEAGLATLIRLRERRGRQPDWAPEPELELEPVPQQEPDKLAMEVEPADEEPAAATEPLAVLDSMAGEDPSKVMETPVSDPMTEEPELLAENQEPAMDPGLALEELKDMIAKGDPSLAAGEVPDLGASAMDDAAIEFDEPAISDDKSVAMADPEASLGDLETPEAEALEAEALEAELAAAELLAADLLATDSVEPEPADAEQPSADVPDVALPDVAQSGAEQPSAEQSGVEPQGEGKLELQPLDPATPGDAGEPVASLEAPTVRIPEPKPEPETEPELGPGSSSAAVVEEAPVVPFERAHWRGLAKSRLKPYGVLVVETAPGVEVQMLAGGQHIVSLDRYAPGSVWVLGPKMDFELSPDSRIRFLGDGTVFAGSGDRRESAAPKDRPDAGDVWP